LRRGCDRGDIKINFMNMAYLHTAAAAAFVYLFFPPHSRSFFSLNKTLSSIFNLNKILFIKIAGNNCVDISLKKEEGEKVSARNVALKLNEVNFFIFHARTFINCCCRRSHAGG
jgi:hypothetical protein